MARAVPPARKALATAAAWAVALLLFFPILWTVLTSFKPEPVAVASPPVWLDFDWSLRNYADVQRQRDYFDYFWNSVILSLGSTALALLVAIPAAWSMAFVPGRRTKDLLMWMLSTKMMPAVGVLVPIYLLAKWSGDTLGEPFGLDGHVALLAVLTLVNLPIVVWMLYTYFREIPGEILEAARMDGAGLWSEIAWVLAPMALPGIASTFLLNVILAWNEAFWTINLTVTDAAPLSKFITGFSSPQGLFYAKLSAASTLAIAPILVLGWFAQRQLVRGLTFGAVK